jgi:hypothetical protein
MVYQVRHYAELCGLLHHSGTDHEAMHVVRTARVGTRPRVRCSASGSWLQHRDLASACRNSRRAASSSAKDRHQADELHETFGPMRRWRKTVRQKMSEWVLHCEVNQRHIRRSQPTRDAALKDACEQLLQGHTVNRIVGKALVRSASTLTHHTIQATVD